MPKKSQINEYSDTSSNVYRLTRESGPSKVGFGSEDEFIWKVKDI